MKCKTNDVLLDYTINKKLYQELPEDVAFGIIEASSEITGIPPMTKEDVDEITEHIKTCDLCRYRVKKEERNHSDAMSMCSIAI
jgi:hypothetical protein